jgi:hypothetical protein
MTKCDGFPKPGCECENDATNHILGCDLCRDCAVAFISDDELSIRLETLKAILTDPVSYPRLKHQGFTLARQANLPPSSMACLQRPCRSKPRQRIHVQKDTTLNLLPNRGFPIGTGKAQFLTYRNRLHQ